MEQYMIKTRADYGSGVARPKIKDKDNFELKGRFLKELRTNTFSSLDHEDTNEHIEKLFEIVYLFHIPNITIDQVMLREFPISLTRAEVVLFYNGLDVPTRQILDSRGAIPSKTAADVKKVNEKVYAAQVGCEQCKGPHYTKDFPLKEEGKTLEEAYYTQFGAPFQGGGYRATTLGFYQRNNANPSYQEQRQSMEETLSKFMRESAKRHEENSNLIKEIRASTDAAIRNQGASIKTLEIQIGQMCKSISTIVEADTSSICCIGSNHTPALVILERPFCLAPHAKIDVFKRKITLRIIRRFFEDYIELNDLNVPLELRRDQVDDLMPTIKESEIVEEFRARNDARMDKLEYKGNNVVGALMNIPIFVGTFSILTDFAVLEDMDGYRNEGMGDFAHDLAAKKSTMLVKYLQSGNLEVLES
ncbi:hypothetical protein Tco_0431858 [Tanacetum coccineum]